MLSRLFALLCLGGVLFFPSASFSTEIKVVKLNLEARNQAYVAYQTGDLALAKKLYSSCLEIAKNDLSCLLGRGGLAYLEQDYRTALVAYEKVIELENNNAWALEALALIFSKTGKQFLDLPNLENLALQQTNSTNLHLILGKYFLEQKDFFKAERHFRAARDLDASNPYLTTSLAITLELAGQFANSLNEYKASLALAKNSDNFPSDLVMQKIEILKAR